MNTRERKLQRLHFILFLSFSFIKRTARTVVPMVNMKDSDTLLSVYEISMRPELPLDVNE